MIDFLKLPRKTNLGSIKTILENADDRLYTVIKVDYNCGLIRFESLLIDGLFINIYSSKLTLTIETKVDGYVKRQYHFKKLSVDRINQAFNNPKQFIFNSL